MVLLLTLALLAFWIYCIFDVATTPGEHIRNLPKVYWMLIVILLADIGGVLWLLLGRPWQLSLPGLGHEPPTNQRGIPRTPRPGPAPPPRTGPPKGPEDDPDFLRNLERRLRDDE